VGSRVLLALVMLSFIAQLFAPVVGIIVALFTQRASYAVAMNPQQYPTLEQFAANVAGVLGKIEVIEQELYDRILYPLAGIASLTFFSVPAGSGFSSESQAAASAKTIADTNMTQNGQLPAPQAFWIDNIQVDFDPGSVATANLFTTVNPTAAPAAAAITAVSQIQDKNLVLSSGWLQLTIGQKPYYTNGPLSYFPPRAQKRVDVSHGNADTTTHNMVSTALLWVYGDVRTLDPGLGLATGVNFNVTTNWQAVQATVANNGRLKVMLGGWLFRQAQ
jgi:hypothetical protein